MKKQKHTMIWTTDRGQKVCICDMADRHLANTIRLLQRTSDLNERERRAYPVLLAEQRQRRT